MTINKSTKDFMWSEAKPMKRMRLAEYCQSPYDAEFRYVDYRKETPHGEIDCIKPKSRSRSGNTANLQEFQWQPMAGYRHSKLNT